MKHPHQYPKRILLAVSGMSPQIVTETLYALAITQQEQPTEIHLISTNTGKQKAEEQLLHDENGQFHHLCRDYHLEGIRFNADSIHVIPDKKGILLDDIKTPEENEAAADFITQKVNEFTRDEDSVLYVSIAGGRKTMGYYLGYALSLYGRVQDSLSHVLVTERYESLANFFYPTPYSHLIKDRDNQELDAQSAQIMLANIPFVRLRAGIPHFLLEGKASFSDSIRFARTVESDPLLEINGKSLFANGVAVSLTEINVAFYVWMIQQTVFKKGQVKRLTSANTDYSNSYLSVYSRITNEMKTKNKTTSALVDGITAEWISDRRSDVNKAFKKALGTNAAQAFLVQSMGEKNHHRHYSLTLTEQQIVGFPSALTKL
ncbi:MAG: CRISPR-associated ring nuclease Csm6 [Methylovulum sp.]|uniref:CRISPR-associated ring nuclease Csm6 n=1 Tax=Methylovulum sp. TaxID=1916980 RepID=UPI00260DB2F5|nr:CRISPR-associated ring nuclease Csm6 [Methylovulum sp.]MDD2725645.1 CRISPR-associated ring nuclease Csm6 [Methylovulum sp.]MDD5125567.1 CRISPR-associated ring nuclease Csm6 [Methylovulum sp.]